MDYKALTELQNKLSALPVLKERLKKLESRILEAKQEVENLLAKYEAESLDVEQLKSNSLSAVLLKLFNKYEGRLGKETDQMIAAKTEYDKASAKLMEFQSQKNELLGRIADLTRESRVYEAELDRREEELRNSAGTAASDEYRQLEAEREELTKQLTETQEALTAAKRVISTSETAMEQLDSAEKWANYDTWLNGGLISHMAKYEHIDNAEEAFNRLGSQLESLQKELSDIPAIENANFSGIDSTTRTIDFWFDNIFTDLSVMGRIREDSDQLSDLRDRVQRVVRKLEDTQASMMGKLRSIEAQKSELIVKGVG